MTRRPWTAAELRQLVARYPHEPTARLAIELGRCVSSIYTKAFTLGLHKTAEYLDSPAACRLRRGDNVGRAFRYQKGHVPANKGLRRPGWGPGRMRETQFKPGQCPPNRDPEFYVLGALRVNADGYIDMRVSFDKGARGWRALHRILWEDAHGPVPNGYALCFKNGERLDVELANLELVHRADLLRRNSVQNLPPALRSAIQLLGHVKRRIRERGETRTEP